MYVKINKPTKATSYNTGSCRGLVKYLSKEQEVDQHVSFFDQKNNDVSSFEVIDKIDNNIAKLGQGDTKYYMLSVNPSKHEQQHILSQVTNRRVKDVDDLTWAEKKQFEKHLKDYARSVMDGYARNFNRKVFDTGSINENTLNSYKNSLDKFINDINKHESIHKLTKEYTTKLNELIESKYKVETLNSFESQFKKLSNNYLKSVEVFSKNNNETNQTINSLRKNISGLNNNFESTFKRAMNGNDILYFGQVEHNRKYNLEDAKRDLRKLYGTISKDEENRLANLILQRKDGLSKDAAYKVENAKNIREAEIYSRIGMKKEGLQSHVHIVVSRKDIENKVKLSPFANARNANNELDGRKVQIGFDRKKFVENCEKRFDQKFDYNRQHWDSFVYRHESKNLLKNTLKQSVKNNLYQLSGVGRTGHIIEGASRVKDPLDAAKLLVSQNPVAGNVLKVIGNTSNPAKLAIDLAKKIGKNIIQSASL